MTPHLQKAIGVEVGDSGFYPLILPDTAAPARRTAKITAHREGGEVHVRFAEGESDIKITKPEPKEKKEKPETDEDDSDLDDDSEEEEEDLREKIWKLGKTFAEITLKDVKKGQKVEVTVNVNPDFTVQTSARVIGGSGVRGTLNAPKIEANGSA